jgi:hypothetical protein
MANLVAHGMPSRGIIVFICTVADSMWSPAALK